MFLVLSSCLFIESTADGSKVKLNTKEETYDPSIDQNHNHTLWFLHEKKCNQS